MKKVKKGAFKRFFDDFFQYQHPSGKWLTYFRVIELCKLNHIQFDCLPPNSTDKLQPLDVGVFAPLKAAWRSILTDFKQKHPKEVGLPKTVFPGLLKDLLEKAKPGQHLPAAFDRCGLWPINPERGMERIPSRRIALTRTPP